MMSRRTPVSTSYNKVILISLVITSVVTITIGLLIVLGVYVFNFTTATEPFDAIIQKPTIPAPRSITPTPLPTLTQEQREQLVDELKNLNLENLPQEALDEILNNGSPSEP